jgi:hypothetical protein
MHAHDGGHLAECPSGPQQPQRLQRRSDHAVGLGQVGCLQCRLRIVRTPRQGEGTPTQRLAPLVRPLLYGNIKTDRY